MSDQKKKTLPTGERALTKIIEAWNHRGRQEEIWRNKREEYIRESEEWKFYNSIYEQASDRTEAVRRLFIRAKDIFDKPKKHMKTANQTEKDPVYKLVWDLISFEPPEGKQCSLLSGKSRQFLWDMTDMLRERTVSQETYESTLKGSNKEINKALRVLRTYKREYTAALKQRGWNPVEIELPVLETITELSNPMEERPAIIYRDSNQYKSDMKKLAKGLVKRLGARKVENYN